MGNPAYFIDWRPVAFLPAHSPPIVSKIKTKNQPMLGTDFLFPEGSLYRIGLKEVSYASRDDGLILFKITLNEQLRDILQGYFDQAPALIRGPEDSEGMKRLLQKAEFRAIDDIARIKDQLLYKSTDALLEILTHKLAVEIAHYLKHTLEHAHTFHAPRLQTELAATKPRLKTRERIENKFLLVEPIRIVPLTREELKRILPQATAPDQSPTDDNQYNDRISFYEKEPINCLQDDRLLVGLKQRPLSIKSGAAPQRKALFELRRAYSRMVDDCIRTLPEIKNQHFLARFSFAPKVRWPLTYIIVYVLIAILGIAAPWVLNKTAHSPVLATLDSYGAEFFFTLTFVAVVGYGHLEFGRRRGKVIDALQRTAGVLEYGAILSNVISIAAMNAGQSRYGSELETDQKGAVRLIDRRISTEMDKRERNKQLTGVIVGMFLFFFTFAAARGNINEIFGWPLKPTSPTICCSTGNASAGSTPPASNILLQKRPEHEDS